MLSTQKNKEKLFQKCLRVGITGGIGSGKSLVCKMFAALGIPIYDADARAKMLLEFDENIVEQVKKEFGEAAYLPDGKYNRPHVAKIVFSNPEKLARLNAIVHPAVEKDSRTWHEVFAEKGTFPYTLKEAALLIESGSQRQLDFLILVTAPEHLRIERVVKRDNLTTEEVKKRIESQMPEAEKLKFADAVIVNDGSKSLIKQVFSLHQKLISMA